LVCLVIQEEGDSCAMLFDNIVMKNRGKDEDGFRNDAGKTEDRLKT